MPRQRLPHRRKPVPSIRRLLITLPFLVTAVILGTPPSLAQDELVLRMGNDFLAGNSRSDDLYSAGLAITLESQKNEDEPEKAWTRFVTFEENLFTDREAGVRFDETWLLLGRRFEHRNGSLEIYGGGVRAGRGLFGESTQNALHRAIGGQELSLDYVPSNEHFAVAGARFRQILHQSHRTLLEGQGELRIAQDFHQWLTLGLDASWQLTEWLDVIAGVGARVALVEYDVLEPWVGSLAPMAELGVVLYDRFQFSWSHNEYGTEVGHVTLAYRMPAKSVPAFLR